MREETFRRALLVASTLCWVSSITLTLLIADGPLNPTDHPGITSIVVLIQSLAITLSVVWAQFRNRKTMVEVMRAGISIDGHRRDGE